MKKFRLSVAADADIRKIAEYTLEQWGQPQRDAYISEIFEAFSRLADNPQIASPSMESEVAIENFLRVVT